MTEGLWLFIQLSDEDSDLPYEFEVLAKKKYEMRNKKPHFRVNNRVV